MKTKTNNFLKRQLKRQAVRARHQKAVAKLMNKLGGYASTGWLGIRQGITGKVQKEVEHGRRLSSEHYQRKLADNWRAHGKI